MKAMPAIRVTITLPYYLRLAEGDYAGPGGAQILRVLAPELAEGVPPQTSVQANFTNADTADPDEIEREKARDANQLLQWTNRLLRRFRAVTRRADIIELTRAQASPFRYEVIGPAAAAEWSTTVEYEATGPQPVPLTVEQTTEAVRNGLLSGTEPSVADLFLLDAERALHQGRFREAVLFCWSTIDSVFNQKYNAIVNAVLVGEWDAGREFLKDYNFGMRNKMSAVMYLIANRSLFREPENLWHEMTESYNKRNDIIHRGENATEDDANRALDVARRIVALMNAIPVPAAAAP
jgi:hypothetical protein